MGLTLPLMLRWHRRPGFSPTDPSPHRGAPVSPLLPVPDMSKSARWAFEIPIRFSSLVLIDKREWVYSLVHLPFAGIATHNPYSP